MDNTELEGELSPVRELTKPQRRALGVLVEKAFTTPEYYPLTLKAVTTGANQKSNRSPVTSYSEDALEDALDELRQLGLAAVVHTESGRTERFRHYMRKRFPFSEPQLAIVTELLLRGRQTLGELRTRASRMVPIESLEELRSEVAGLIEQGYMQASGPLERRGVEVDHAFYPANEGMQIEAAPSEETPARAAAATAPPPVAGGGQLEEIRLENRQLRSDLESLRAEVEQLRRDVDELRSSLGG
jgi:hypothetical protein